MEVLLVVRRHGSDRGCHHLGASLVTRGFPCTAMHTCYRTNPISIVEVETTDGMEKKTMVDVATCTAGTSAFVHFLI